MKPIKPQSLFEFGACAALFLTMILVLAVPIAASQGQGRGRESQNEQDDTNDDTRAAANARADIRVGVGLGVRGASVRAPSDVPSLETRRDLNRTRRLFQLPTGILNAACVQACVDATVQASVRASSTALVETEQVKIKNQCMEKCRAEKDARKEEQKEQREEKRDEKNAFRANFSQAIRALNERQKAVRDDFKDLKDSLKNETTRPLTEEETAKLREAQDAMREKVDTLREQKQELIESVQDQFKTPRLIARGEMIKINRALDRTREDYSEAKKMHVESRTRIEAQKKAYHECVKKAEAVEADETAPRDERDARAACKETKKQFTSDAKTFLLKTADLVVESLNKLKYQVKLSEDISEEDAQKLLDDIEQRIIAVKNARASVEELKEDAASQEELKAAAKTIREAWQETRALFKKDVGVLMQAKLGNIIHRMDQLTAKFERARDRLKEKGADVTALDELLSGLDGTLAEARANYEAAVKLFVEAHTAKDVDAVTKKAHELVKKARADLKEAQQMLRDITAEIKAQMRATAEATVSGAPVSGDADTVSGSVEATATAEASADASA